MVYNTPPRRCGLSPKRQRNADDGNKAANRPKRPATDEDQLKPFNDSVTALDEYSNLAKGDADAGAAKVMVCAGCHGVDGNSMVPAFPKLAALGEKYLFQQLRYVQTGERVIVEMTGILDASTEQDLWIWRRITTGKSSIVRCRRYSIGRY